ncbi:secreted RxLR effector protein 161-like [Capsicum annuum]|uniref:secreted RxLR effector protein 161-like n=1 Tax=Capsicum annuum TaxID=4072 RepID=UPI001FB16F8D|nr:secreted RxLR effector protein 161-like [Capsicum annuum]
MKEFEMSDLGILQYFIGLQVKQVENGIFISQMKYKHCPTKQHFGAAKKVLRYVAGTVDFGIWYSKVVDFIFIGYSDSDWAGSIDNRKSTSENVFSLGSGAISWSLKKQDVVALSSSEAKYVAVTSTACQVIWLRRLLIEIFYRQKDATKIFCDNKATIAMTKNLAFHSRPKHIDIRYHFIRDLIAKGDIELKF